MTTHTIQIEGLPEGLELSDRAIAINRELHLNEKNGTMQMVATVFLQKTKQRRIVLEETKEARNHMKDEMITIDHKTCVKVYGDKIWRIKED